MKANNTYYKVTAINSGIFSLYTDKHVAETELNNLLNNGKPAKMESVTEAPTETEKEEKTIEVEIYHDGDTCNAIAGGENPAVVGWVDKWFNNTFAAGMQFGIKARKAIAIEELTGRDLAHHGFMTAENAKLWLVDQIRDYFRDHGYNLKVVNL